MYLSNCRASHFSCTHLPHYTVLHLHGTCVPCFMASHATGTYLQNCAVSHPSSACVLYYVAPHTTGTCLPNCTASRVSGTSLPYHVVSYHISIDRHKNIKSQRIPRCVHIQNIPHFISLVAVVNLSPCNREFKDLLLQPQKYVTKSCPQPFELKYNFC